MAASLNEAAERLHATADESHRRAIALRKRAQDSHLKATQDRKLAQGDRRARS